MLENIKINNIYISKIVGKDESYYKIKIVTILENTAVVELVDEITELAVVRLKDIKKL
ncbi:hypothetical protein ACGWY0_002767 [Enterococcus hirae]